VTSTDRQKKDQYRKYLRERGYELVEEFNSACSSLRCALEVTPYPGIEAFYRQQIDGCRFYLEHAIELRKYRHSIGMCVPR